VAFRWKKSLAQLPQLHKNSFDLIVGRLGTNNLRIIARLVFAAAFAIFIASCAAPRDTEHQIVVSVRDQKLALLQKGNLLATYPVSTSKFGLGDRPGSFGTPLGELEIANKIGDGAPAGTVFKDRRRTGEVIPVDAPGRDPIVTRIIWLRGREAQNANAYRRDIYIHGTPEERNIGRPASYGCIRMRSADIINLYSAVGTGAEVSIIQSPLVAVIPELSSGTQMVETNHSVGVIR
jgi:lipoprotein-anchoring transpeptidase ErfK/SrfK